MAAAEEDERQRPMGEGHRGEGGDDPTAAQSRKRKRPSHRRRRMREVERDAARRALNGNGMSGNLPPLPTTEDANDGEPSDDKEEGGGGVGGFGTLFGHPYGALPYGNIHLAAPPTEQPSASEGAPVARPPWHPEIVRHSGLGPHFRLLNDEQLLNVLSYVDGPTLGGTVVRASRFLYVAGHHEELWRDLTLRRWGEGGFKVPSPPSDSAGSSSKSTAGCWRDVYACNHRIESGGDPSATSTRHEPIRVPGVYSDTFFRSWLCRSFALQPSWLSTHTVPIRGHGEMTSEIFLNEYEERNIPVLIKGASSSWDAVRKWSDPRYLLEVAEGKRFRATSGAAPLPASFTMDDYLNYCASSTEEAPLYLFDRTFATKCPQLLQDFDPDLRRTCGWWSGEDAEFGTDLFRVLGEGRRPDYQWLIVGPKRSGSCFHIDPNCTHAWNAPIIGRKRWIFYPPGVTPPGVYPSPCGDDVCMPISIGEWFLTYWNEHVERRSDPDVSRRPLECTASPGDVLFVPHGWWHMVMNIGDDDACADDQRGVSIALTRNYVSASNLSDVLRFLDTRVSQISGCRDRAEAVQPEDLGREFRKALTAEGKEESCVIDEEEKKCDEASGEDCPRRGKWAGLLEIAEKRAKEGWGCDAWADLPPASCSRDREKPSCPTAGSSILARAKQHQNEAADPIASTASGPGGGFSFSFL